jgi:hypothetical protein
LDVVVLENVSCFLVVSCKAATVRDLSRFKPEAVKVVLLPSFQGRRMRELSRFHSFVSICWRALDTSWAWASSVVALEEILASLSLM